MIVCDERPLWDHRLRGIDSRFANATYPRDTACATNLNKRFTKVRQASIVGLCSFQGEGAFLTWLFLPPSNATFVTVDAPPPSRSTWHASIRYLNASRCAAHICHYSFLSDRRREQKKRRNIMLLSLLSRISVGLAGEIARPLCVKSTSSDCYANLALEELMLRAAALREVSSSINNCSPDDSLLRTPPLVCLSYINDSCVVLGRNQNAYREACVSRMECPPRRHRDASERRLENVEGRAGHEVWLARRTSGGGAVFHDTGNVNFCIFTHREDYDPSVSIQLLRMMLATQYHVDLSRLTTTPRHDLFLDGKKISGSAMRVGKRTAYHHFTLLVNTYLPGVRQWLAPSGKYISFASSAVESVRSPVTTLQSSVEGFADTPSDVQRKMFDFIHEEGWNVFSRLTRKKKSKEAVDLATLGDAFGERMKIAGAQAVACKKPSASLVVDVDEDEVMRADFVTAPGERAQRGDEVSVASLVVKYRSVPWLLREPGVGKFVTLVTVDLSAALPSLSSKQVAAALLGMSASSLLQLAVETTVENGAVSTISCRAKDEATAHHDDVSARRAFQDMVGAILHGVRLTDLQMSPDLNVLLEIPERVEAALARCDVGLAGDVRDAAGGEETCADPSAAATRLVVLAFVKLWANENGFGRFRAYR